MCRLPLPARCRGPGGDHPGDQGPGGSAGDGAAGDDGASPGVPDTDRGRADDRLAPRPRRGPGDEGGCGHAPRGPDGRPGPARDAARTAVGPLAACPGAGARPGRGAVHPGEDAGGDRRAGPGVAVAAAGGRRAGRCQGDRLPAHRVLRPPARPPAGRPPRPDRRPRRPAPRLLQAGPDRGHRAADPGDTPGRGPALPAPAVRLHLRRRGGRGDRRRGAEVAVGEPGQRPAAGAGDLHPAVRPGGVGPGLGPGGDAGPIWRRSAAWKGA